MTNSQAILFADGASSGNPGPSGWAYLLRQPDGFILEAGGHEAHTTNNRMELFALLQGLKKAKDLGITKLLVCLDSTFVIKGATQWISGWKKSGWKTSTGKEVEHKDLWIELAPLLSSLKIEWNHVPGHAGIPGNDRVDEIAVSFSKGKPISLYSGKESDYPVDLSIQKSGDPVYLSYVDGALKEHKTWSECERVVKGKPGAKFKKIHTTAEREKALKDWGVK